MLRTNVFFLIVCLSLSACAWLDRGNDYRESAELPPLEVPPGLSTPPQSDRLAVPDLREGRVSAVETAQREDADRAAGDRQVAQRGAPGERRREKRAYLDDTDPDLPEDEQRTGGSGSKVAFEDSDSTLREIEGVPVLTVRDKLPATWRRTSAALERIGLEVEDENREQGFYLVRYTGRGQEQGGRLSELFEDGNGLESGSRYRVYLLEQGNNTLITAHAEQPLDQGSAENVLRMITAVLQDGGLSGSG